MAYDMNENIAFNLELNLITSRKYGMIFYSWFWDIMWCVSL